MEARGITQALGGRWQGRYGLCRCPVHADKTPSLKVRNDARKSDGIDVVCFAGCDWRDVKAALVREGLLAGFSPEPRSVPVLAAPRTLVEDDTKKQELAAKIWEAARPLPDTLGWRYFTERRGLHIGVLETDHCLRWHEGFKAIVALMTDAETNAPTGIHRTFLNDDGTKRDRKMLGRQGAVRLSPNEDVTQGLGICEGIEDGLAVLLSGWSPTWAVTSAGAIERFPLLEIEALTIFTDRDETGQRAAEACAKRWAEAGREVSLA